MEYYVATKNNGEDFMKWHKDVYSILFSGTKGRIQNDIKGFVTLFHKLKHYVIMQINESSVLKR